VHHIIRHGSKGKAIGQDFQLGDHTYCTFQSIRLRQASATIMIAREARGLKKVSHLQVRSRRSPENLQIIVVGTGPAGLVLCLLLARHGIQVECLDSAPSLDERPRATHYGPPANRVLEKVGLLEKVRKHGIEVGGAKWRKPDGTAFAHVDNSKLGTNPDRISCLPLNSMCKLALEDLVKEPLATVKWNHRVTGVRLDADKATVVVEAPEGTEELSADYVVGCDGANSIIRKSLLGDDFPGFTWDLQIIATNVSEMLYCLPIVGVPSTKGRTADLLRL
jgi:hypothetical protein